MKKAPNFFIENHKRKTHQKYIYILVEKSLSYMQGHASLKIIKQKLIFKNFEITKMNKQKNSS